MDRTAETYKCIKKKLNTGTTKKRRGAGGPLIIENFLFFESLFFERRMGFYEKVCEGECPVALQNR